MTVKLAVIDLNGVLTRKTLAVELLKDITVEKCKKDAYRLFKSYREKSIGERGLIVEGSKCFKGLSYETIQREAQNIQPTVGSLDLPGWETAIISFDYVEAVKKIADDLGIPRYFGNQIIYENGLHSGRVREPIVDYGRKKEIVEDLRKELGATTVVGIDNESPSPFDEVCETTYQVTEELTIQDILAKIRTL